MSNWDSDIAALLDDVLQDNEPEAEAEAEAPAPPQHEKEEPLSCEPETLEANESQSELGTTDETNTTLADLLADDSDDSQDTSPEVTTVVTEEPEDSISAGHLPKIEFSTAVENDTIPLPTFTSDELMDAIDVRNFGTLVSLTNRRWHAKIKDRKAAKDAADQAGADGETFEARKRLLVGADEKLKAVHKAIDAARTDHYRMTLPWSTVGINDIGKRAGPRLLPNTMFFEYTKAMGKHKADMDATLDEFVQAYPTLIAVAQQKLGTAFNQMDYPRPEVIKEHFALSFDFDPIPSGGDFQGLQDAQVQKLAGALARKTRQKLENALADAWARLYEDVKHAATVLLDPNAMFHYTLVDKLREHGSMLEHLNVTKDTRLEQIRTRVKKELTMYDIKDVRKDDALRKQLGDSATDILTQMEGYANGKP